MVFENRQKSKFWIQNPPGACTTVTEGLGNLQKSISDTKSPPGARTKVAECLKVWDNYQGPEPVVIVHSGPLRNSRGREIQAAVSRVVVNRGSRGSWDNRVVRQFLLRVREPVVTIFLVRGMYCHFSTSTPNGTQS